ncbi:hypothetical protein IEO21_01009 [Rhodonia placenta]|uniref:Uncharacterized protein n=1 Tax=Rhodonia placenta TaxID=104341 RepID=A0A8H7PAK2_9APHY|nr:hypothetical protein IEO21_01009 [Postia placenta]
MYMKHGGQNASASSKLKVMPCDPGTGRVGLHREEDSANILYLSRILYL